MFSLFTHVMKPVRDTNSERGLPVMGSARGLDQESQPWQESAITALGSGSAPFFRESGIRLIAECDND